MISVIQNSRLKVGIDSKGAELNSMILKKDGTEYLWQADPSIWGRHAPVLFPIVGKVEDDKYKVTGKEFNLSQHGFARDMEFKEIEKSSTNIIYQLSSNDDTLSKYPFPFQLNIVYALEENMLAVLYNVKNTGGQIMYFSIGAHPGFNCPLVSGESMADYFLEFEADEKAFRYYLDNGLISGEKELFLNNERKVALSPELFRRDAIILHNLKSHKVSLKSNKSNKAVTVEFPGFPYLGIWSKPQGAPFVCIEPWYGIADTKGGKGDFTQKEGIQSLQPLEEFKCQYNIILE